MTDYMERQRKLRRANDWLVGFMSVAAILIVGAIVFSSCSDSNPNDPTEGQLSVPTQTTVLVDGYPLTCVTDVGYSNYGGGISCDWDTWRELKDGA